MARRETSTGGRSAAGGVIPGRWVLSVGNPGTTVPSGFAWRALTDLARLESGHTPSRRHAEYWGGDIPWIGIRDATQNHGSMITSTSEGVSQEGIDNSSARVLPAGTVCLSRTASVGFTVMMGRPMSTSQDFVNWVCGPELNPRYLMYLFMLEQESIRRFAHGTTHQTMYYPEAKALHVAVPDRAAQDRVVEVLGALDDLMDTNRMIARACSELRRGVFADVMARADEVNAFRDIAMLANERACASDMTADLAYLGLEHFQEGGRGLTSVGSAVGLDSLKSRFRPGDVLYGRLRPYFRKVARPDFDGVCSTEIWVLRPTNGVSPEFVEAVVSTQDFTDFAMRGSGGTHMPRAAWDHVATFPVRTPRPAQLAYATETCRPLWEQEWDLHAENVVLCRTRDELLPILLTGAAVVREAEA